jgi:hypothetical protein
MQAQFMLIYHIVGDLALFINGQASVAKSHPESRGYPCRIHPRNEIFNAFA